MGKIKLIYRKSIYYKNGGNIKNIGTSQNQPSGTIRVGRNSKLG
jgi:hypothetical protein